VTGEVAIPVGCGPTHIISALDHGIQCRVGACSIEQWFAGENVDAWRCVGECGFAPWSGRNNLHHIEFAIGVADALTHMGCHMVQGGTAISIGIQWCTELCLEVQCYAEECRGAYFCTAEHDDAQQVVGVLPPERSPNGDVKHTIKFGTLRFGE